MKTKNEICLALKLYFADNVKNDAVHSACNYDGQRRSFSKVLKVARTATYWCQLIFAMQLCGILGYSVFATIIVIYGKK